MWKKEFILATLLVWLGFSVLANPASAFELEVNYSDPTVTGPVCLDLDAVPEEINVIFELIGIGTSPSLFDIDDVLSVQFKLGDAELAKDDLDEFAMETKFGIDGVVLFVTTLDYNFVSPFATASATEGVVVNNSFQLTVSGHCTEPNMAFNYFWADSTQVIDSGGPITPDLVPLDVKPRSCPNPLNVTSGGVLPVAILGRFDFDVTEVDIASVRLEGVPSHRSAIEDVASPFEAFDGLDDPLDCTTEGPDGMDDLTLKFKTQDVVSVLGEVSDGYFFILTLTGNLKREFGENQIEGQDGVVIKRKGKNVEVLKKKGKKKGKK